MPPGILTLSKAAHQERQLLRKLVEHKRYIAEEGEDLPEIREWKWKR